MRKIIIFYHNRMKKKKENVLKKRFPSSIISINCFIDDNTELKGENVIHSGVNISSSIIGVGTYILSGSSLSNSLIGSYCSVSSNVIVESATHPLSFVSTYPGFFNTINNIPFGKGNKDFKESIKKDNKYDVIIGNDVWIGRNVLIKGGITIGDGAVIGMGAIVTKDVPPYAIVGGVPAKVIRYRFDQDTIDALLRIKWWDWPLDLIKERREEFIDVKAFIKKYDIKENKQ